MNEVNFARNLVINNRELKYKGIFIADELFSIINRALEEKGYQKVEKKTEELVTDAGRRTFLELRPYKTMTEYVTLMIKIKITLDHVTETIIDLRGEKEHFQQGDIEIVFDAWSLTDYNQRWGMKPLVYFLKGFINRYLYRFPLERSFNSELIEDTAYIYAHIKKLFNTYQLPQKQIKRTEEGIRKEIEKEMAHQEL